MTEQSGRILREALTAAIRDRHPGQPPADLLTAWDELPPWRRRAADAVYGQVCDFICISAGAAAGLSREQKGTFVHLCQLAQILRFGEHPDAAQPADWALQPAWMREAYADTFEAIENHLGAP